MKTSANVDASIVQWAERGFNRSPVSRARAKGLTGLRLNLKPPQNAPRQSAGAVRARIGSIAKRTPQVMVRISGGGKGMRHIRAHLAYITRNGKLPAIDQNDDRHLGRDELRELGHEMQFGGFPVAEVSARREAFNIILSMPEGTEAGAVCRAALRFAADEFHGYQYAMVLHSYDSDPYKDPARHPHVHLCVKAMGDDGRRLNPRKQDLQRWRERFAERLREQGIDAAASSRLERLQPKRGEKQSVLHKKARGETTHTFDTRKTRPERAARAQRLEILMLERYKQLAYILADSPEPDDRRLAATLGYSLAETRGEMGRGQSGRPQYVDKERT